jgi:hypothetical protein
MRFVVDPPDAPVTAPFCHQGMFQMQSFENRFESEREVDDFIGLWLMDAPVDVVARVDSCHESAGRQIDF